MEKVCVATIIICLSICSIILTPEGILLPAAMNVRRKQSNRSLPHLTVSNVLIYKTLSEELRGLFLLW